MSKFNIAKSQSMSQSSMRRSKTSFQGTTKFCEHFRTGRDGGLPPQVLLDGRSVFGKYDAELPVVDVREHAGATRRVVLRSNCITGELVETLVTSLMCSPHLTDLRLEFCNLDATHLDTLSSFLRQDKTVRFLSVRGNGGASRRLHSLVEGTNVESLSAQLCAVDDEGVATLSSTLTGSGGRRLVNLNLSGNVVTDEGVKRLADCLRSNRTLASLNVSDNCVGEEGLLYMARVFEEFPLRHEEVVFRRRKIMERLKRNRDEGLPTRMTFTLVLDQKPVQRNASTASLPEDFDHPFIAESAPKNMEIVCVGNNTLLNLNISYNNVTVKVLNVLIDVVKYQKARFANNKPSKTGLARITFDDHKESRLTHVLSELHRQLAAVATPERNREDSANYYTDSETLMTT